MLKKRKTNRPIQNWKKGIAILIWHWLVIGIFAQSSTQFPEISTREGLPTYSTRRVVELSSGSIAIATDAGFHYAPKNQPALAKIKESVGVQQCWDLHVDGNKIYVATYNYGLYIFDVREGNLIKHFNHPQLIKIRKFRKIKNRLFCIARRGVFEIKNDRLILILKSSTDLPDGNMPMDIFIRKNKLHVLSYPQHIILQQQQNGSWANWQQQLALNGQSHLTTHFCNLTAFQTDSFLFIGGVNQYVVIDAQDRWTLHRIEAKNRESWAFWDFQLYQNQIYGAVSNSNDFNEGYLHLHIPGKTSYTPTSGQSLWSITPSKFRDALWVSTSTNGVHLTLQPSNNLLNTKVLNSQFKATEHFIVQHTSYEIYIYLKSESNPSTNSVVHIKNDDRIREALEINGSLFLFGAKYLWKYNQQTQKIDTVFATETYQWALVRDGLIWLFKPYENVWTYNPTTKILSDTKFESKADCVKRSKQNIFYHIMGKGFAYINNKGQQFKLNTNHPINQYTLNFEVVHDKLLIENGNAYDYYQIDLKTNTLRYLRSVNLTAIFGDIPIFQVHSNGHYLYLYLRNYLVELELTNDPVPIKIKRQIYLGQWRIQGLVSQLSPDQFLIDRGNTAQVISLKNQAHSGFQLQYSYRNLPESFFRPFLYVNTQKNFRINIKSNSYFDQNRSLYQVDLVDVDRTEHQYGFFRGDANYWINGIEQGKYNLSVSSHQLWRSQFILGTTDFYRDLPFWLMLLSLLTLLYWVFYNQLKTQESQQKRIATLQLKTLQSNFNPHFIYNSMSLIQSLIISSETKKAIDVTARLAKLNRLFLSNSNKELIYLKEELDFIKEYVAMEKLRFESDTDFPFRVIVSSKVRLTEWLIPPLILQPLIENAIKHGVLVSKGSAEIIVNISLYNPNTLNINIINTQANPNKKRIHGMGIGNQLVIDRLAILNELYPNQFNSHFEFGFNDDKEYVAQIQITRIEQQLPKP